MIAEKIPEYAWMDGAIVHWDDAKVHFFTPAGRYGLNVFEGIRAYWNEEKKELYPFRIKDHYQRLFESMKIMRIKSAYSIDDCERFLLETIRANHFQEDIHIRHLVYVGGYGGFNAKEPTGMVIFANPKGRSTDLEKGLSCCISSWTRISDNSIPPRAKVGSNYQNSRLAGMEASENGYDRPILLSHNGKVSESSGSCFFMVRKGVVVTPPVTGGILESITRDTLMELCKNELDLTVKEREIDRTEVYVAEEALLCGSGMEVTPVISVDKIPIGDGKPGTITKNIIKLYFEAVRGKNPKYSKWLTPTYGK